MPPGVDEPTTVSTGGVMPGKPPGGASQVMARTTPPTTDRQSFLANLRQSGLIAPDQMAKVASRLPQAQTAQAVAKVLVEGGLLTRFQAELLLAGKTSGFFLGQYRILDYLARGGMGPLLQSPPPTMNPAPP